LGDLDTGEFSADVRAEVADSGVLVEKVRLGFVGEEASVRESYQEG